MNRSCSYFMFAMGVLFHVSIQTATMESPKSQLPLEREKSIIQGLHEIKKYLQNKTLSLETLNYYQTYLRKIYDELYDEELRPRYLFSPIEQDNLRETIINLIACINVNLIELDITYKDYKENRLSYFFFNQVKSQNPLLMSFDELDKLT